jgi:hypothetical protein
MICESESEFRRDLIDRLAASPIIMPLADGRAGNDQVEPLALKLGVTPQVLITAVRVARMGLGMSAKMALTVFLPIPVAKCMHVLAKQMDLALGVIIRSVLHAAMQTAREPHAREDVGGGRAGTWRPLPGSETFRENLTVQAPRRLFVHHKKRGVKNREDCYHTSIDITVGLAEALQRRAAAYRCSRHMYVCLWLADLVDGKLADLPLVPTRLVDCHPDERMYTLPTIEHDHPLMAASAEVVQNPSSRDSEDLPSGTDEENAPARKPVANCATGEETGERGGNG